MSLKHVAIPMYAAGAKTRGLVATMLLKYDLIVITEMWWDKSCDWSMAAGFLKGEEGGAKGLPSISRDRWNAKSSLGNSRELV